MLSHYTRWILQLALVVIIVLAITSVNLAAPGSPLEDEPTYTSTSHALPDWHASHVTNQLLVKLPRGAGPSAQVALTQAGARVLDIVPQLDLALVEVQSGKALSAVAII